MKTLHNLFLDELADICDTEQRLTKVPPKMATVATHEELRGAFEAHLEETEGQSEDRRTGVRVLRQKCQGQEMRSHRRLARRSR